MKPQVVLIAGWGMPSAVMQPLVEKLSDCYTVNVVSLPGFHEHGLTVGSVSWSAMTDALSNLLAGESVILAGWSMGGQLATLFAAMYPHQVKGLLTLASNPCFVQRSDWPDAMPETVFSDFEHGVSASCSQTLKQFCMLCSQGGAQQRETVRLIRKALADVECDAEQLSSLLTLLRETDTRSQLADLTCPVTHWVAEQDALVPFTLSQALFKRYSQHVIKAVEGGHTFWLEMPDIIVSDIDKLVRENA
ncbi:alpha/beta fold hydrolase [Kistimonas asteriae]|uniref:alpha/beta fold hydrolase n=1 Tax=Kistimonas asteriae TaxID=517724 RepID=UPI001BA52252|nr:alpha/beta fold hydrolase [Kistimonas asteriae]